MFRSSLFVPACCSKWLSVQLARMIGRIEVEVLEVEKVGFGVHIEWAVPFDLARHDDGDDAPNDENDDPNADDTQVMD